MKDFTIKPRPNFGTVPEEWANKLGNADLILRSDKRKDSIAEAADFRRPAPGLIRDSETAAQRKAEPRLDQTQTRLDIRDQVYHAKLENKKLLAIQEANEKAFLAFQFEGKRQEENEASRQQAVHSQAPRETVPKRRKGWKEIVRRWANAFSSLFTEGPKRRK